jgi:prepilin-type N-terminal cleavage/methylation domain-containing protein
MRAVRTVAARLRAEERGFTLIELLTVMVILSLVLAGLTAAFTAGVRAEMRANKQFQAQQNARLALDRFRRDVHCASAVTATPDTPVASVTVTLPAICAGADTSVTYATQSAGTNRYQLMRTGGTGTPIAIADYITSSTIFTYTAPATGTLGKIHVDIPVNLTPADAINAWRLVDDIVLRNTDRL